MGLPMGDTDTAQIVREQIDTIRLRIQSGNEQAGDRALLLEQCELLEELEDLKR